METKKLYEMKKEFTYDLRNTNEISFPLGGIGTGCIGIAGNGRLIDWEIFNRPNKRSFNGFSHFAVKAESNGVLLDARVLNGDLNPPYTGEPIRGGSLHSGYGFGPESSTMAGMPHFKRTKFIGEFPIAKMQFSDDQFPGMIELTAFNPFIPLNDKDSSIPGAFFEFEIENTTDDEINYTVCLSAANPLPTTKNENTYNKSEGIHYVKLSSNQFEKDDPEFGDISIATDAYDVSYQEFWYRGGWCDNLEVFWRNFGQVGSFKNRTYGIEELPSKIYKDMASLAAHFDVLPGEKKKIKFVITWNYPNMHNHWNPQKNNPDGGSSNSNEEVWKTFYSTIFKESSSSSIYSLKNWERLYNETYEFKNTLFSSTIPDIALEAISANLSVLKSPTCLRLTDGSFYGFEGCIEDIGCCEGSCTHVWNYAYALPFLFPQLERSMHDLDFKYNQRQDGRMSFRLMLPLGREAVDFRACVDGQFGGVIKAYRDWKISGDDEWLKSNWEAIKKSIEYAWAKSNEDKWDSDKDGVIEGRQHHTLDMELFGPNSWLNGFYLAALKAGAQMAEYIGDNETSKIYFNLFNKGKKWTDENLFNGEYYCQKVNLNDKSLLEKYSEGTSLFGEDVTKTYWNEESEEIKYQIGEGCEVDQVSAQWHANLCGLGEIFDKYQLRKALVSLYKYNFIPNMRDIANTWRLFCLNDEGGVIICSWPEGRYKPIVPLTYSTEVMTGFEYQTASLMIQEGLIEEGLNIIKAIRSRYDGEKRNPFNEFECGSNYARSMASYSLLLSFSGFEYDMVKKFIGFSPVINEDDFKCFWSLNNAWGSFSHRNGEIKIEVKNGSLELKAFKSKFIKGRNIIAVKLGDSNIEFDAAADIIHFKEVICITADLNLYIIL